MCSTSVALSSLSVSYTHLGGDVVAQHDVQLCVDELACLDLGKPGMCGKDLLRQGHSPVSYTHLDVYKRQL